VKVKDKIEFAETTNRYVYNRIYKLRECKKTGKCDICKWHSGENMSRRPKHRSWKDLRYKQYDEGYRFPRLYRNKSKIPQSVFTEVAKLLTLPKKKVDKENDSEV